MGWRGLATATAVAVALTWLGCGSDDDASVPEDVASAPADSFYLGQEFDGLPLTTVLPPPTSSGDSTSFIYGDCEPPEGEGGCAPPLEVQTWPLCSRPPQGPVDQLTEIKGALGEIDPRESRVEIFTGENTVVIFGSAARAKAAIDELRQRDDLQAAASLEPPAHGAC